jgi:hypothetical protein
MKKLIFFCFFVALNCQAQKIAYYKAAIVYDNGSRENGWLYDISENEVSLIDIKSDIEKEFSQNKELAIKKVPITGNIKRITLRRKDKFLRTLGTLTGISLGGGLLIGYISGDDKYVSNRDFNYFPTWESKAFIFALIGLYGTLYATIPISIMPNKVIYKRKLAENNLVKEFENYTLVNQFNNFKKIENLNKPN